MENKRSYLYEVILEDNYKILEYRYDVALKIFEEQGKKMYAFSKVELKPLKVLLMWK